jgi:hypothetical protein
MNHFPFFPKKFRDDEVGDHMERFLRPGLLLARERSLRSETAGAELSVAGPKTEPVNVSSTRFSRPATMTAGRRHSTLFPQKGRAQVHARFGGRKPGSEVRPGAKRRDGGL